MTQELITLLKGLTGVLPFYGVKTRTNSQTPSHFRWGAKIPLMWALCRFTISKYLCVCVCFSFFIFLSNRGHNVFNDSCHENIYTPSECVSVKVPWCHSGYFTTIVNGSCLNHDIYRDGIKHLSKSIQHVSL